MKVFLIAGEPSGDRLGAALMAGFRDLAPDTEFLGVGGPAMQAQGVDSIFPMSDLAVMGIAEVLPKYRTLKRRIQQAAAAVIASRPDVLVTIDSPDFGLRVQKIVRDRAPEVARVHYVAPSVWAWRPGRAQKMARTVQHVLAILPFEPPLMRVSGLTCDFVGHPVVAEPRATAADAAAFRATHGIATDAPLLLCLPGSRRGEVSRIGPTFQAAIAELMAAAPDLRVVIPTVPSVSELLSDAPDTWPGHPILVEAEDAKRAAFAAADLALAASGTVSLELAANDVPMVIGYDMAPLSRILIGLLMRTDTVTLVNLVSGTRTIPEFLGKHLKAEPVAEALAQLLTDKVARAAQVDAMNLTMERLGRGQEPPGRRAAQSVIDAVARLRG
ncbi:MAG: lipid-A-disaccharide synthase [Paracoccus denitrificans]|nr:MAG: lipid-A-disaccharide synthase [Paracoccus denitrificans]PZO84501.1 MAG: lipid-A-disaccharide synthase [Paracoccus denitrificans]